MAFNACKQMGTEFAWEALIGSIEADIGKWDIIMVSECDGVLQDFDLSDLLGHTFYRHWPGHGSYAMATVLHRNIRPFLRSITPLGRAVAVQIWDPGIYNITVIGVHGAHGEALNGSLGDLAALYHQSDRHSDRILVGDWNVDLLPKPSQRPLVQHYQSTSTSS